MDYRPKNPKKAGRNVTILGVHQYSSAYPNTKFVIDHIMQSEDITSLEIRKSLFTDWSGFDKKTGWISKYPGFIGAALRAIYCHTSIFLRFWSGRKCDVVYVPYPAIGVLLIFSLLPGFLRPRKIIAEAFISIYDTAVTDRKLIQDSAFLAKSLKAMERRAYQTATLTTVDTEENQNYYSELFALPPDKFVTMPLATDEHNFGHALYTPTSGACHVLFIGTFVPLQGTEVIARAIVELEDRRDISFTILGTGQSAAIFSGIIGDKVPANTKWIRQWQDSESLARYIRLADICLGIFSDGPKANRVWPFKNYAYMACGRAIITGDTACARRMLAENDSAAFVTVPTSDHLSLAAKIQELADSPGTRETLARNARRYYDKRLCDDLIRKKLIREILIP